MKAVLGSFVVAVALAAAGVANAGMLSEESEARDAGTAAPKASSSMNSKEQWACEVALCMANPNGPMAVTACVAPIKKMYRELAKGHVIPRCKFLGSSNSGGGSSNTGGGSHQEHAQQQQQ